MDFKAKLQKAKDATRVAREVSEVAEATSYERGVQKTEIRLMDEVAEVCRDYCKEVWAEALNWVGVSATSEWRSAENIFYPKDIQEVPTMISSPAALPFPPPEKLSII